MFSACLVFSIGSVIDSSVKRIISHWIEFVHVTVLNQEVVVRVFSIAIRREHV